MQRKNGIETVGKYVILSLLFLIVAFLILQNSFTKVRIMWTEEPYMLAQDLWVFGLLLLGMLILFYVIKRKDISFRISSRFVCFVTISYLFLFAIIVLLMQLQPRADQQIVLDAAHQFLNGNYQAWDKGGYCEQYPNQNGIILLLVLMEYVFGEQTWIFAQLINIICIVVAAYATSHTFLLMEGSIRYQRAVYLSMLLYVPLSGYVSFVYGTIPGLMFVSLALYCIARACKEKQLRFGWIGAVFLIQAAMLKNNYLITIIAVELVLLFFVLAKRQWKMLVLILFIPLLYMLTSFGITSYLEYHTGKQLGDGIPSTAWLAMGLQEGEIRAPGWYNGYNKEVYIRNQFDTIKADEESRVAIADSLEQMFSEDGKGLSFFAYKIGSQWNDATYEAIWTNQQRIYNQNAPAILSDFLWDGAIQNRVYRWICDIILWLMWSGILFWVIWNRKRNSLFLLVFAVNFLGGFLFHIFWEAKGQYALTYVWLLIPYALRGWHCFYTRIFNQKRVKLEHKIQKRVVIGFTGVFLVLVFVVSMGGMSNLLVIRDRNTEHLAHLHHSVDDLVDGDYQIYDYQGRALSTNTPDKRLVLSNQGDVFSMFGMEWMMRGTKETITAAGALFESGIPVFRRERMNGMLLYWYVIKEGYGYRICCNKDFALTRNEKTGEIYLDEWKHAKNQIWQIKSMGGK